MKTNGDGIARLAMHRPPAYCRSIFLLIEAAPAQRIRRPGVCRDKAAPVCGRPPSGFGSMPRSRRAVQQVESIGRQIDRALAGPMFGIAALVLLLLAGVRHVHETHPGLAAFCGWGMLCLFPLFVFEYFVHRSLGSAHLRQNLWYCLLPPLRLGARDHATGRSIWLPIIGWQEVDEALQSRVAKAFSVPMIVIALMVLPLMAAEFAWANRLSESPRLALAAQTATGLIWLAFTLEFIVMISIVEKKLQYCRQHWVDLAVILLPLAAFLRAARLGRLLRLQQLTRTARVYRMRGLLLKAWHSLLLLDAIDRIVRGSPEARLTKLHTMLAEKEQELQQIRDEIRRLQEKTEESGRLAT